MEKINEKIKDLIDDGYVNAIKLYDILSENGKECEFIYDNDNDVKEIMVDAYYDDYVDWEKCIRIHSDGKVVYCDMYYQDNCAIEEEDEIFDEVCREFLIEDFVKLIRELAEESYRNVLQTLDDIMV